MSGAKWSSPFDLATRAEMLTDDRRAGRQTGVTRAIFQVFAGLTSVRAEAHASAPLPAPLQMRRAPSDESQQMPDLTPAPTGELKLLADARDHFQALHAAYPSIDAPNAHFLKPDEQQRDTSRTLCTAVELLLSRRSMRSFLAHADRFAMNDAPVLSPRMTYLRFHVTDALFGSYLLRVGSALGWLSEKQQLDRASPFGSAVRAVSQLKQFTAKLAAIRDREWAQVGVHRIDDDPTRARETVWRHIGLLDVLRRGETTPGSWLPKAPSPPRELVNAAAGARKLTQALMDHSGALDAIETFLFHTEPSRIAKLQERRPSLLPNSDPVIALNPIIKAHNFDLMRATFAEAGFDVV
jgi:hypothetical protein